MKTSTLRRSRTQRGAAMIEGIVVVSTMLVFMGLITYTRQGYGMKLDLQQSTRANTAYYSAHGCTGDATGASASSGTTPGGSGANVASNAANKGGSPSPGAGGATRTYNTASASANGTTSFQYVFDKNATGGNNTISYDKKKGDRPITAASKQTCNELDYSGQSGWTSWMTFGMSFATRGGGGIGDLFK